MSAPQITEEAPGGLGSLNLDDAPVVGPTESWPPRLASVTPIPSTEDTGPIETVPDAPRFDAVPRPAVTVAAPQTHSEPVTIRPVPTDAPIPSSMSTPEPAAAATDIGEHPSATFSQFPMERFYPVIYWTSVLIGLVSQVIGWGVVFGGTLRAYIAAAIVGGICELTMVTASDKGLNWTAEDRPAREFAPFLLVSTAAACIAVYMVATHWAGELGLYLAVVSAGGYVGHMLDGGFKAMRQRRIVQHYERQVREQQERAEAEAERQRQAAIEAEEQRRAEAEAERQRAELAAQFGDELPSPTRKGRKPTKQQAIALGVHAEASTLKELRTAITDRNFALPAESTLKNYLAAVKAHLS